MSPLGLFLWFAPILIVVSAAGCVVSDNRRDTELLEIGLAMTAAMSTICWLVGVGYAWGSW